MVFTPNNSFGIISHIKKKCEKKNEKGLTVE